MRRLLFLLAALAALGLPSVAHAAEKVTWCGKDQVTANRVPDVTVGPRVRFVYAMTSGASNNFDEFASGIATDAALIDAWWRAQDPTRTPRFDRYPFPGCTSKWGALDIGFVQLPHTYREYFDGDTYRMLVTDMEHTFPDDQKTLVYVDLRKRDVGVCGEAPVYPQYGSWAGISLLYLYAATECSMVPIGDGSSAEVATHELLHNLGATVEGAPHRCVGGHVCDAGSDILYPYIGFGSKLDIVSLDYGRDDYYGHGGTWWDVQDSLWLQHLPARRLTITVVGSGTAIARYGDTTLPCEEGCTNLEVDAGAVGLGAAPSPGWVVAGWSGSCRSTNSSCDLGDAGDVDVTVTFVRAPVLVRVAVKGKGRVTTAPAGISCPGVCRRSFPSTTPVRLVATPAKGWKFLGFLGGCNGRTCTVDGTVGLVNAVFVRK